MDQLIKREIAGIINQIKRGDAPNIVDDAGNLCTADSSEHLFDVIDVKEGQSFIVKYNSGSVHYLNGRETDTYSLRFICYDEYMHRFTYDDGKGNTQKSMLKKNAKLADYIVFDKSDEKVYFIVQEITTENVADKRRTGRVQLSDTVNQLYKSKAIADYIDGFKNKICFLSAKDGRTVADTLGMADGFNMIYRILPEPIQFNFGQIGTHHFTAFETSIVKLDK